MDRLSRTKFTEGWVSLRTVMMTRTLFGFYCNISCSRIWSFLARLYCICLVITLNTLVYLGFFETEVKLLFSLPLATEYNLNVLISIITGENHHIRFYEEIERIDREMGLEHQPFTTFRCQVLFLVFSIYKIVVIVGLYVLYYIYPNSFFCASSVMSYSVFISNISRFLPLDLLSLRVKHLWYGLEMDLKRVNWRENINQINSVMESLKLYRHFMDNLMVTSWEKFLICINFTTTFCSVILYSHDTIISFKTEEKIEKIFILLGGINVLATSTISCLPAILCEMVSNEVEKLKMVIGNALLVCDDDDLHAVLLGATDYLALRPFSATICRAFALDAPLVLTFVSLCTTYTIVVIQYLDIL